MARASAKSSSSVWLWVVPVALIAAVAAWWMMRPQPVAKEAPKAGGGVAVEVAPAVAGDMAETLQVAGQVAANTGVELRSEVTGRVVAVNFRDGDTVAKGASLVVLDDSVPRATLAQAEASYELAEANVGRYKRLVDVGAASALQVDQAVAQAKLEKANIQMAKANLAKFRIAAPFAGSAGIAQVSVGDLVQPGELLVALTDNATLKATFKVPEAQAASLTVGAPVVVTGATAQVDGVVDALDGRVDPASRTLEGKVLLDNEKGHLLAGQFVRVRVPVKSVSEAVIVPDQALVPQGNTTFVYVIVTDESGAVMASRTTVDVGLRSENKAQIVRGIAAGHQVVTAGQQKLQAPLMPVKLLSPTAVSVAPQAVEELR
ncbi:MAG: efflux transporter periplasmic adaptor subunit [Pseudomonas fluorescens]|nr:MAG: efflux transporter periplasmic adaptor subunit [Pseudomonas fluorescens]